MNGNQPSLFNIGEIPITQADQPVNPDAHMSAEQHEGDKSSGADVTGEKLIPVSTIGRYLLEKSIEVDNEVRELTKKAPEAFTKEDLKKLHTDASTLSGKDA